MELYVPASVPAQLERSLAAAGPQASLEPMIALAWRLRQRDTRRAERLGFEAYGLVQAHGATPPQRARLALARAECALLLARIDEAESLASDAGTLFGEESDARGLGDCALLRGRIAEARGERSAELERYAQALE